MSDRYLAPPRTADIRGLESGLGVLPQLGAVLQLGFLPNLGLLTGGTLFSWAFGTGVTGGTFTRATDATFQTPYLFQWRVADGVSAGTFARTTDAVFQTI